MSQSGILELFNLAGKVAIITGGSRGLGLEMAEALGEAGARVVITARKEPDLKAALAHLKGLGHDAMAFSGSAADPDAIAELLHFTVEAFGRIDILVNNAGVTWGAPTLEMPADRWRYVLDVNLTGPWLLTQAVCRVMVSQGDGGRIINVVSLTGLKGEMEEQFPAIGYATSKAGLVGLTRMLAAHMAPHNILVNAIAPGWFQTKMSRGVLEQSGETLLRKVPLGRAGRPGELKGAVLFLASPASSYVSGQVLSVDGGATAI